MSRLLLLLILFSSVSFADDYLKIAYGYGQLNMRGEAQREPVFEDATLFSMGAGAEIFNRFYLESLVVIEVGKDADVNIIHKGQSIETTKSFNSLGISLGSKYILIDNENVDTYAGVNYLLWTGGETYNIDDTLYESNGAGVDFAEENLYTSGDFGLELGWRVRERVEFAFKIQQYSAADTGLFGFQVGLTL